MADKSVDDQLSAALKALQAKPRRGSTAGYIDRHFDDLERANRDLHWSYKDLAGFLTDNGRPTSVSTLKYNMKRIRAQRDGQPTALLQPIDEPVPEKQQSVPEPLERNDERPAPVPERSEKSPAKRRPRR